MKVWLDDVREAPEGWVRCYWPDEVTRLLSDRSNQVTHISLDHDLGDDARGTGYDVLEWIEEQVAFRRWKRSDIPEMAVHSANPVAVERMNLVIWSIHRHARKVKK